MLSAADTVAGYGTYIDLIKPLILNKKIIQTGMTKEIARVEAALEAALADGTCALISSGDPGVYALAGLVFELCRQRTIAVTAPHHAQSQTAGDKRLRIEVVPGIPALASGAALLGAPIGHDFAVISLSDLLTPWPTIIARLEAAARADFVIVLYNPKSKRRPEHLAQAQQVLLQHRHPDTPVGIVTGAMRANQAVSIVPLKDLHAAPVDMQTTVFVGSSASVQYLDFLFTPRGYAGKYDLNRKEAASSS